LDDTDQKIPKWTSFTYSGHYIRKVTKLFTDTHLKIAYKTTSTLDNLLKEKQETNQYEQSGIYKLTCQSCQKVYIGQTGRKLSTRYKEHIRSIRLNKDDSAFEQRILNKQHQYGPMNTIMKMVEQAKKGNIMNIKENFHIYHLNKINQQRQPNPKRDIRHHNQH
jgi:hypothetical protein